MKIRLAADGSKFTRHAVNYLIGRLRAFGTRPGVHLIHVRPVRAS